jgi:hypothetical protein
MVHYKKVYCDGKLIMEVGGTQEELVDIWSEIILLYRISKNY